MHFFGKARADFQTDDGFERGFGARALLVREFIQFDFQSANG